MGDDQTVIETREVVLRNGPLDGDVVEVDVSATMYVMRTPFPDKLVDIKYVASDGWLDYYDRLIFLYRG